MFQLPSALKMRRVYKMKGSHLVSIIFPIIICHVVVTSAFLSHHSNRYVAELLLLSSHKKTPDILAPQKDSARKYLFGQLARYSTSIRGQEESSETSTTTVAMLLPSDVALAARNSESSKPSKSGLEFFAMMDEFAQFTERDINSVQNQRLRALFEGVQAGGRDPKVLRAFEVLYEDLIPLRVAGKMIYRNLKEIVTKSTERQKEEEMKLQTIAGLTLDQIDDGRKAFMKLSPDGTDGELSLGQLVDAGVVETMVELLGFENFDDLMVEFDQDRNGKLNFEEFMIGIQRCTAGGGDDEDTYCTVGDVLGELQNRMAKFEAQQNTSSLEKRQQKYNARYDNMVQQFKEWESISPNGDGRMVEILRGCFAGAKNKEVVDALRIVYVDYSALRMSGDLIFGLMEKIVKSATRKKKL